MITKKQHFQLPEPALTPEQEAALVEKDTHEARAELVMNYIKAGFAYGRAYCGTRFEDDELLSVVYQAMMAAAKRFRLGRQTLIAFCKPFIRGELHRAWKMKTPIGMAMPEFPPPPCGMWSPDDEQDPGIVELDYVNFDYDSVDREALLKQLTPFFPRLTKHERVVVDLLFFGGYNQTDAANLIGVDRRAVNQVLKRVSRKFRNWLS